MSDQEANGTAPAPEPMNDDEPAAASEPANPEETATEPKEGKAAPDKSDEDGERDKDKSKKSDRKSKDRDRDRDRKRSRRSRSREKDRGDRKRDGKDRDRDRGRDRDKDRDRDRDRDRSRRSDKDRDRRSDRDRERRSDKDKEKERRKSRSPVKVDPAEEEKKRQEAIKKAEEAEMRAERERNREQYTTFVSSIHPKVDERDLFEFFSMVGRVEDIRLIRDQRTQKSKGLCYVEFWEKESVHKAVTLTGQLLGGYPITIAICQAQSAKEAAVAAATPMRLYVGSLHPNVSDADLKPVFEAFGPLDFIDLHKEADGTSKGFGFVQYKNETDAKAALQALDGLKIADKAIKVGMVDQQSGPSSTNVDEGVGSLEDDMQLTSQGRAALMAKLGRGAIPGAAAPAAALIPPPPPVMSNVLMIQPTTCVVIKNMFDPKTETEADFDLDIKLDVEEEAVKFGTLKHIFVDKNSQGNVFLRFHSVEAADQLRKTFHGRWFATRQISAEFVIEPTYIARFPESK